MTGFWISLRARRDLHEIWNYIADDSETAADRWYDAMMVHFRLLGASLRIGKRRDEWRRGFRSLALDEYLILYRIGKPGVRIMRIIHGRRDLPRLFH